MPSWSLHPVVEAVQGLRGVALITAVTLAAEIGDCRRFTNPRQLMGWLGLVPKERSSGSTRTQGAITKAGNSRARRMLVESAWTYRLPPRIAGELLERSRDLPERCAPSAGRRRCGSAIAIDACCAPDAEERHHRRHTSRVDRLHLGYRHPARACGDFDLIFILISFEGG